MNVQVRGSLGPGGGCRPGKFLLRASVRPSVRASVPLTCTRQNHKIWPAKIISGTMTRHSVKTWPADFHFRDDD